MKVTATTPPKGDPRGLIALPNEVADLGLEFVRELAKEYRKHGFVGVPLMLPGLNKVINNQNKGDMCIFVARPGGGKTAVLMFQARSWATMLPELGRDNEVVVVVAGEQTVEAVNAYMMAAGTGVKLDVMINGRVSDADLRRMEDWSRTRATLPLVVIGKAVSRRSARLDLSVENLDRCLEILYKEQGLKPSMIAVDYLQRLALRETAESKAVAVGELVNGLKNLAMNHSAPLFLAAQARREADRYDPQMPGPDDVQWSSSAEQDADTLIALVRPIKYKREKEMFGDYSVTRNLYLAAVHKQRWGDIGMWVPMNFDPALNDFSVLEERIVHLNPGLDAETEDDGWKPL